MSPHRITEAIRIRATQTPDKEHSSPLFLTSSFCYDDAEDMRAVFADEKDALSTAASATPPYRNSPTAFAPSKVPKRVSPPPPA